MRDTFNQSQSEPYKCSYYHKPEKFMTRTLSNLTAAAVLLFGAEATFSQNKTATWLQANFQARTHTSAQVTGMTYRLYKPIPYDSTKKYPIVVALHGIGERGNNNVNQLTLEELAQPWVRDSVQAKHPHFVMIPQCPTNLFWWPSNTWDGNRSNPNIGIVQILDSLKREFSLDTTRFYAVGLSMGGFGTIELMKWNSDMFAAAVPTAGGGDTSAATIAKFIKTPMWAFHGAADPTVNVDRGSRTIVNKMQAALGKPFVRFTSSAFMATPTTISIDSLRKAVYVDSADYLYSEVTAGNHAAGWLEAWRHPMLTDWVFSKRKGGSVVSVTPFNSARTLSAANVRLTLGANGRVLLERAGPNGLKSHYNLEGQRILPNGSNR
jgi:predicted peptidase